MANEPFRFTDDQRRACRKTLGSRLRLKGSAAADLDRTIEAFLTRLEEPMHYYRIMQSRTIDTPAMVAHRFWKIGAAAEGMLAELHAMGTNSRSILSTSLPHQTESPPYSDPALSLESSLASLHSICEGIVYQHQIGARLLPMSPRDPQEFLVTRVFCIYAESFGAPPGVSRSGPLSRLLKLLFEYQNEGWEHYEILLQVRKRCCN